MRARFFLRFASIPIFIALAFPAAAQSTTLISLDEAINLALAHNHSLKAARTEIFQNQAEEITANLRTNPTFGADTQFVPIFSPQDFSGDNLNRTQQFDVGISYLFERGRKRQHRLQAARDATAVTRAQVSDAERTLGFDVGQQFVGILLAESTLQFALEDLRDFQQTVDISQEQFKAGYIGEGDFLKIKLQLLQFQTDVSAARLAREQALVGLRQFLGYDAVPSDYDVIGELGYQPIHATLEDLQLRGLKLRPDYRAAQLGITAAQSQLQLAKANAKVDVTGTYDFSHVSGENSASIFVNFPLPVFDRNQGEIARSKYALTQSQEQEQAASDAVLSDVANAYEAVKTNDEIVKLYSSGYLQQAKDSRGALWVRATMPYTISFEEAGKVAPQIRDILMSYPQVTVVASELGRPDDGTDPTGFFNCEFYVGLKPYKDKAWHGEISDKKELIDSVNKKLTAFPGIIFNHTQPAEDAVDEALAGLKSSLAVKIYGNDLDILQNKALQIKNTLSAVPGFTDLTVVRELGQPSLLIDVDRDRIARYGINVDDVEAVISAAVGGQAITQVIQGEKLFDLVVRMQPQFRSGAHEIGNLLVGTPDGQQIPLSQLADIRQGNGASLYISRKQLTLHRGAVQHRRARS